jgi:hypothetical protein
MAREGAPDWRPCARSRRAGLAGRAGRAGAGRATGTSSSHGIKCSSASILHCVRARGGWLRTPATSHGAARRAARMGARLAAQLHVGGRRVRELAAHVRAPRAVRACVLLHLLAVPASAGRGRVTVMRRDGVDGRRGCGGCGAVKFNGIKGVVELRP